MRARYRAHRVGTCGRKRCCNRGRCRAAAPPVRGAGGPGRGGNGDLARSGDQRPGCRAAARRFLCRRHRRRDDRVRHARHRQHRPSGLHHAGLLSRLSRRPRSRARPDSGRDPGDAGVFPARHGGLSDLLFLFRATRRRGDAGARLFLRPAVRGRGRPDPRFWRRLPVCRSALYRAVPLLAGHGGAAAALPVAQFYRPSDPGGVAGPRRIAADGGRSDPHQAHRLRHRDRHGRARRRLSDHHPAGPAFGRPRLSRPGVRDLRARRHDELSRHGRRGDVDRHRREPDRDLLRTVLGAGRGLRLSAIGARRAALRHSRALTMTTASIRPRAWPALSGALASTIGFWLLAALAGAAVLAAFLLVSNEYLFFAGYVVLQYVVLATAWNILGGYTGYVNFGVGAFFASGAYSTVVLHKLSQLPLPVMILCAGVVSGVIGLGMGYLTLRLRGVFFAIATLALAIVLQTLIVNWDYVGGSRGVYVIRPEQAPLLGSYVQYLFLLMLILAVAAVAIARTIERSRLGLGFAAIRDDEPAAEAGGVPTLRLKLIATVLSGALMGMAGAPLPYYVTYLDPDSSFSLAYAVNSVAMPLIGGTTSWTGPVIGAVLLGTVQQLATVTISSALNLMIVGLLLIAFVIIAPNGIVGLVTAWRRRRSG